MTNIQTIDAYIQSCPDDIRALLQRVRETILEVAPDAEETIAYGMPSFKINGKRFIYFAAWKHHLGLYPIYKHEGPLEPELQPYRREKDSLHLPLSEPFPYDLLKKIVSYKLQNAR
jgi:uncharacterized protein YdhG (YjbR/CyaY superfamily)